MKMLIVLSLLFLSSQLHGFDPVKLSNPANQALLYTTIPSFVWEKNQVPNIEAMPSYRIQIASDKDFSSVVDEDTVAAVIGWYVPCREFAPGTYWWRVTAQSADGKTDPWSHPRSFSIRTPERVYTIRHDSDFQTIEEVLAAAAAHTPSIVRFEPGNYRLEPGEATKFIVLRNIADLTIDGAGANIVITRPVGWADLENCSRVLIKNLVLDFDPPAYTAAKVLAVDTKEWYVDTEILPGHAFPTEASIFDKDRKGLIATESEGFGIKKNTPLVISHSGFQKIGERTFRFRFENQYGAPLFDVGDHYVLGPRWLSAGGGHGTVVKGGKDVVFFNLVIRSAANECLTSFYADRHALLNVRLERKDGRALSVNNGGNNHHNARMGPWIEGCLFENCGDDACHVNGYSMAAIEQPAADKLVFNLNQPFDLFGEGSQLDFRSGDTLLMFQPRSGRLLGQPKVLSASLKNGAMEVVLDRSVEGLRLGRLGIAPGFEYAVNDGSDVTEIYNASRMCNEFVFRHNTVRNSRRAGVLAKGRGGLIEHNTFESLGGGGVEFWNAPFEGLAAEDYVVWHNRILDCGRLQRHHAAIWAAMFKGGADQMHRRLLVTHNEIRGFPGPAIMLGDTDHALVRHNLIRTRPPGGPIRLNNTRAVHSTDNVVTFLDPNSTIPEQRSPLGVGPAGGQAGREARSQHEQSGAKPDEVPSGLVPGILTEP